MNHLDSVDRSTMTEAEARECANKIRGCLEQARGLILDLHERKGWRSLGYKTWDECVQREFGQARTSLHYQLEAARVAREIKATDVQNLNVDDLPDSHLRALAPVPNHDRSDVYKEAVAEFNGKPTAAKVKEVVDRKLNPQTPTVSQAKESGQPVSGWVENDNAPPRYFEDQAEIRDAFKKMLDAQNQCLEVLRRHGNMMLTKASKEAASTLRRLVDDFQERLPLPPNCDPLDRPCSTVVILDGEAYAHIDDSGRWTKSELYNLDRFGAVARSVDLQRSQLGREQGGPE